MARVQVVVETADVVEVRSDDPDGATASVVYVEAGTDATDVTVGGVTFTVSKTQIAVRTSRQVKDGGRYRYVDDLRWSGPVTLKRA